MWNGSIKLVTGYSIKVDEDGFEKRTAKFIEGIPADFHDTTRTDQIVGHQSGYNADQNIQIMACNYSGEQFLVDESTGIQYEIVRTYRKDKSMKIVLTCQRREFDGSV